MRTVVAFGIFIGATTLILDIPLVVVLGALGIGVLFSGRGDINMSQRQLQRLLDENRY